MLFYVFIFLNYNHPRGSISWLWFAFPWWWVMLSIFSCAYGLFVNFLWRNVHSSSLLIFESHCLFLLLKFSSSVYIRDINPLSDIWFANIFSRSMGMGPFQSVGCTLWYTNVFNFDKGQLTYFFFCWLCFWCHSQEVIAKSHVMKLFHWFLLSFIVLAFTVLVIVFALGLWSMMS